MLTSSVFIAHLGAFFRSGGWSQFYDEAIVESELRAFRLIGLAINQPLLHVVSRTVRLFVRGGRLRVVLASSGAAHTSGTHESRSVNLGGTSVLAKVALLLTSAVVDALTESQAGTDLHALLVRLDRLRHSLGSVSLATSHQEGLRSNQQ